jgi:hypothetical protein
MTSDAKYFLIDSLVGSITSIVKLMDLVLRFRLNYSWIPLRLCKDKNASLSKSS